MITLLLENPINQVSYDKKGVDIMIILLLKNQINRVGYDKKGLIL